MSYSYIKNTKIDKTEIIKNISQVLACSVEEISDLTYLEAGLSNVSFLFEVGGEKYIYRHPGVGTNELVNRKNEKQSCELAKKWGIDTTLVYMDGDVGWKISRYLDNCRMPEYRNMKDSKLVAKTLKQLHQLPITVDYSFNPYEDSLDLESKLITISHQRAITEETKTITSEGTDEGKRTTTINELDKRTIEDLKLLKEKIKKIYNLVKDDGVSPCFCHGDSYKYNWLLREKEPTITLIDWEYAGMADPGVDVGYYIIDAMYDYDEARDFISSYIDTAAIQTSTDIIQPQKAAIQPNTDIIDTKTLNHYMAYAAIVAYYWYVWAVYRVSTGNQVGEALSNWKKMAEYYVQYDYGNIQ